MYGCWILVVVVLALVNVNGNDVRRPPSIYIGPKGHVVYIMEEKIELPCVADGFPQPERDAYVWTKNGEAWDMNIHENIKRDSDPAKGTIIFDPISRIDEGYYQCIVRNAYGTAVSDVVFLQTALMAYPAHSDIQNYDVDEYKPLKVACELLKSVPKATYRWVIANSKDDSNPFPLDMNRRVNIDDKGNLYFAHVMMLDSINNMLYKCNANNAILDITKGGSYSRIRVKPGRPTYIRPSMTYQSESPTIGLTGQDIRLRCLFSGNPEATVSWSRVDGNLPYGRYKFARSGTELIIQPVERGDEATYRCEGKSRAGTATGYITLDVQEIPVFKTPDTRPHNINATDNDDVSFLCDTTAEPEADIKWYINGKEFVERSDGRMHLSADRKNLSISSVCKSCQHGSDLMNIQCNASNIHGYAYSDGYLNVFNPTKITNPPKSHKHQYFEDIVFHCHAVSDAMTPVYIYWYFQGKRIVEVPGRIEIDEDFTLRIKIHRQDTDGGMSYRGVYTCEATNGYSLDRATANLTLPDFRRPPSITSGPKGHFLYNHERRQRIELVCVADGFPQPTGEAYVWIKNGEAWNMNIHENIKRDSNPTKGTIIFDPIYRIDEGYYQCIVRNAYGTAVSDVVFLQAAFMANYSASSGDKDYHVHEGKPLRLTCDYLKSVPNATYSWLVSVGISDHSVIPVDLNKRVNIDDSGHLYFAHTKLADGNNNKLYICAVHNAALGITKGGSFSRVHVTSGTANYIRPYIAYQSESPKIGLIGKDIRLRCLFSGNPEVNVTWSRIGGNLPPGRYDYARLGTELIIHNIELGDEATYRCEGNSIVGTATADIILDVQEIPVFKTGRLPYNRNATDNDDVIFLCDTTAEPEADIKWYINGREFVERSDGRMHLSADRKNLSISSVCKSCQHGSDLMNIQCNASNIHGYAYNDGYLNVLNETTIINPPRSYEHVSGEDIVFHCKAVSDVSTPVHINWYFNGSKIVEEPGRIKIDDDFTLRIKTENEVDGGMSFTCKFTCEATNGYSTAQETAELLLPGGSASTTNFKSATTAVEILLEDLTKISTFLWFINCILCTCIISIVFKVVAVLF